MHNLRGQMSELADALAKILTDAQRKLDELEDNPPRVLLVQKKNGGPALWRVIKRGDPAGSVM